MERPVKLEGRSYYNLIDLLKYIDQSVPGFKKKVWRHLCDLGYIKNDTTIAIWWEGMVDEDLEEEILDGINRMLSEFPDIKEGKVDFEIRW